MKVRILGCGTSSGVPRVGDDWGLCDRKEPKNRRRRVSILLEALGSDLHRLIRRSSRVGRTREGGFLHLRNHLIGDGQ